jgi:L-asparaginase
MKIKVLTTGGSLDKGYSTKASDFVVMDPQVSTILDEAGVTFEYEVEPLLRKDSLELTDVDRMDIRRRVEMDEATRILITHGTDTMAETGQMLEDIAGKTIVLTGAMQPATFKRTDAHFNIGFAVAALQTLPHGVYLAMNGAVFSPGSVKKNLAKDRFEDI